MDLDRQVRGLVAPRPHHTFERPGSDIKKIGYLKKLKTNKKRYFVLRSTSSSGLARLEYYDSERKFKANAAPKRSIQLNTCFNINRQSESRHCKNGIVLYTKDDSFVVLAESPEEQDAWLSLMLEYQYDYLPDDKEHREHYEFVWAVVLQPKGLGKGSKGHYRVCLNNSSVSLIKAASSQPQHIIQLPTIRNIAQSECSFCMEVGKYAPTGEGKFWFQADDAEIVKDMHSTLHHYMNSTKDPSLKKETSFRSRSESHSSMSPNHRRPSKVEQRPASFYTSGTSGYRSSMDTTSPGSVSSAFSPTDHILGSYRPRSDTGDSRISRGSSQHENGAHDFFMTGDMHDTLKTKEFNVVPPDMSPPPSPKMFDEQLSAYMEMDSSHHSNHSTGSSNMMNHHVLYGSGGGNTPTVSSPSGSYMAMSPHSQSSSVKGELSPSLPDSSPSASSSYMSMAQGGGGGGVAGGAGGSLFGHASAPIPIHPHVPSHPTHPTPLPTVREGGSNEGYLPMDVSNSPSSSANLRPEPVKCMLSLDNDSTVGLPPRTYSLGSKPVGKKYPGYMEMGSSGARKGSLSNDMLRAISAPHIIHKGRRDRDRDQHPADSPIPSPLSMSIKSDDSDSFMEYMPMRPRTASDSFNYRPRTSSLGKLQPMCRPRSSSHGQGTRPVTKFSKLAVEQSRISQEPLHRMSRESSLHDSFDSLRVSNESLRRMSQDLRHSPVAGGEQGEGMRGSTPPPPPSSSTSRGGKNNNGGGREMVDSYMAMELAGNLHHKSSSPHRMRTDSNSSSHRPDYLTSSQESEYTEMTPIGGSSRNSNNSSSSSGKNEGEDYMNMAGRRPTPSPVLSTSLQSPPVLSDAAYVNMDVDVTGPGGARRSDSVRSASVENVESYIMYDPAPLSSGSKLRAGSVGSKDKKFSLRVSAAGSSKKPASGFSHSQQPPPTVSASTKKGGSSDSIRKPTRQSSMENKYGSLGKDFRKKSGSTGSRPMSSSSKMHGGNSTGNTGDMHHSHLGFNMVPIRKLNTPVTGSVPAWNGPGEDVDDEYIEFSPNAYRDSDATVPSFPTPTTTPTPGIHIQLSSSSSPSSSSLSSLSGAGGSGLRGGGSTSTSYHHHHQQHQQQQSSSSRPPVDNSDYTPFSPSHTSTGANKQQHQLPLTAPLSSSSLSTSPSTSSSNSATAATTKTTHDDDDYTPFAPAGPQHPSSSKYFHQDHSSHSTTSRLSQPSGNKKPSTEDSDYVGYDPTPKPTYFSSDPHTRQKIPKVQHHSSLDSGNKLTSGSNQDGNSAEGGGNIHTSTSLTFDPSPSSSSNQPRGAAPLLSYAEAQMSASKYAIALAETSFSYAAKPKRKIPIVDDSEYLSYDPAVPAKAPEKSSGNGGGAGAVGVGVLVKATSLIRNDDTDLTNKTPLAVNAASLSSSSSSSLSTSSTTTSKLQNNNASPSASQPKQQEKQVLQQQRPSQNIQQQQHQHQPTSPLACITSPHKNISEMAPSPHSSSPSPQPPSPLPAVSENIPPWNTTPSSSASTRQKHASGSSTSSQKSRRISGDSDNKSLRKSSKSDSNSSLSSSSGSKSKRRMPSGGEKSPQSGSAEKSPLSPAKSEEFFCGSPSMCSGKSLEAKMVPVESKIRHSLGDVTPGPGSLPLSSSSNSRDGQQGLSRPGSTPCIQQLDSESSGDNACRLAGSNGSGINVIAGSEISSGGSHSSSLGHGGQGSRSRHSLSDLGAYQQMNHGGALLECSGGGGGGSGSNNGSGDSCSSSSGGNQSVNTSSNSTSVLQPENGGKPLNYAQLDLSCGGSGSSSGSSGGGGGGSGGSEVKSRNSSDADEKQPPLSYAKIDFAKSQNMNKAIGGGGGDANASKT